MKKILLVITVLFSALAYSQGPQTTFTVADIATMKIYFGKSSRIHVIATNEDFVNCPGCTPDEVTIYDGAGSRNWKKVIDPSLTSHAGNTSNPHSVTKSQVGLGNVENTALSSWAGSANITTLGTIGTGTWNGTAIGPTKGGTGLTSLGTALQEIRVNAGATALEYFTPAAAGNTIYTGDGTLAGARAVALNGNALSINQGANAFLSIDPTAGSENVLLQSYNTTGNDNVAAMELTTSNTTTNSSFYASFNSGSPVAQITLHAESGDATAEYSADTHTMVAGGETNLSVTLPSSFLRAFDATDDGNESKLTLNTTENDAEVEISAKFNDGVQEAQIRILTDATTSSITHTAAQNIFSGRVLQTQGADVASVAGAITLGSDGNVFEITGTNAITLISNLTWQNGATVTFIFTSTATLTDGTANSGTDIGMELDGNTNFTASADDAVTLVLSEVGGTQRWREISRSVN